MGLLSRGERGFIEVIRRQFRGLAPPPPAGIGDDAAVLMSAGRPLIVSTDSLVESIDFRRGEPAYLLGRKALAVNLSDLAAMGASPLGFLLTLALPDDLGDRFVHDLLAGMAARARTHGVKLLGGDLSRSPGPIAISITILGNAAGRGGPLTREGARPGDGIWVSGPLGASAAGRMLLEWGWRARMRGRKVSSAAPPSTAAGPPRSVRGRGPAHQHLALSGVRSMPAHQHLALSGVRSVAARRQLALSGVRPDRVLRLRAAQAIGKHFDPQPRLALGQMLRRKGIASSAIDVSDGLSTDLAHLAEASGVGARVLSAALPIADQARACARVGADPVALALHGGEDYELLFTVPRRKERLAARLDAVLIGRITRKRGLLLVDPGGREKPLTPSGFDHFRPGTRG